MNHSANLNDRITVILGAEYDDALRARLVRVLGDLGVLAGIEQWSVAGSQELLEVDVYINGDTIRIESETYIGLSVTGPAAIVEKIHTLVRAAASGEL